ncbi:TPA: helix-turn-helix domain-containing protein [Klebsiella pneumoniae]|nr:helix-turn-helix domain-containing protein [Klebsiella pneumoniae]NKR37821.1 helix-turn-helix domain-containing protein [Klebsiella variicola]POT73479.1 Hin recombinase [Klebsiella michiganensis]ELA0359280.1 helix-turn-helix domain-containing protein [Klebsiella pneumoniae]ELA2909426.1 helix-turn-helix domain-containing protein [Klebsiella pneumoniae]
MTVCRPQHFIERIRAGLAAARERGRIVGRRRIMTRAIINRAEDMLIAGATRQQVADVIGVDVKTIYRYLPASE